MERPTIFFDNRCLLCSRSVRFVSRHDRKERFLFASLDSQAFAKVAHLLPADEKLPDSVVLLQKDRLFFHSDAALRIAASLRFPVSLLAAGFVLPRFLRDALYDMVARRRYRWFGRSDSCFVPSEKLKERFLD